ncbi:MAG: hypothetical protein A4E58_02109 [Syntrophorhabdus sp. PtaB.Bin006]|nr:MAG: hypothetical protein A4E58_02109 [Syntrophorhabdus sp. PtaB.Bin006]
MKPEQFVTADLYLGSAISILLNQQPTFKVENGRTLFCFPVSNDLYAAMVAYNNGIPLNAYEYAEKIKRLRAEMLMRREQK